VITHLGKDSNIGLRKRSTIDYLRRRAARIHVHSPKLSEDFLSLHPEFGHRMSVIPHGTYSLYKHWDKDDIEREKSTCLFFGRMEKYRGLDNLMWIAEKVKKEIRDLRILVAGRGTELKCFKEDMVQSGVFEIHDEFIPDDEVFRYFKRASLLLLPYHEGSQSGVIHVGLAFGVPIVATDVGALSDAVQDGVHGKIVSPGDLEGFAQAVITLLKDEEKRETMKQACLEKGEELDFNRLLPKYEEMYRLAISGRDGIDRNKSED
jgi:glycosyltransferase involved in cell wall biosynthesis